MLVPDDTESILELMTQFNAQARALDILYSALDSIMHYPKDDGPCHSGSKENYEWQGRSPKVWDDARKALDMAKPFIKK